MIVVNLGEHLAPEINNDHRDQVVDIWRQPP